VTGFPFDLGAVLVFLATAGVLAPLLHRFRLTPVLTFLLVGLLVGPHGLGRLAEAAPWIDAVAITDVAPAEALAEVGVVLLLFLIGLEVSAKRLWGMRRLVLGLGGAQLALSTAALGVGASVLGASPQEAFVIGAALALSSTAIVLELLIERRQLGGQTGQATLSTLLAQDLAVAPMLILVAILAGREEPGSISLALAQAAGAAAIAIGAIMIAGRLVARPFLRRAASRRSPEMFVAAVLLLVLITGAVTQAAGLSIALGAFLAGLLLAESEYRHEIEVLLAPFKGLLIGIFFLSIGMRLDFVEVLAAPLQLVVGLVCMLAVKTAVVALAARLLRVGWPAALESALLLAPGGEFAFVILATAGAQGVLRPDMVALMGLIAGASMMLTPLIAGPARRLAEAVERRTQGSQPPATGFPDLGGHVLIVGYGRIGRMMGELLSEAGVPMVALDRDANLVGARRAGGEAVFFGDARYTAILSRLAADRAAALVVTMDEPDGVEAVVRAARRAWPALPVYARARDSAHAGRLVALGAERVTPEALEASLDLAQAVLAGVGLGEEAARAVVEARRRSELESIAARAAGKPTRS
jgi:CPA2 family monovalent cation:H+ antiporter-2